MDQNSQSDVCINNSRADWPTYFFNSILDSLDNIFWDAHYPFLEGGLVAVPNFHNYNQYLN